MQTLEELKRQCDTIEKDLQGLLNGEHKVFKALGWESHIQLAILAELRLANAMRFPVALAQQMDAAA
jgi:hypothetical protein